MSDMGWTRALLLSGVVSAMTGLPSWADQPKADIRKMSYPAAANIESEEVAEELPVSVPPAVPSTCCGCQSATAPTCGGHCFHERTLSCPGPHCRQLSCGHCGQRLLTCHPNGTTGSCVPESNCRPVRIHEDWARSEIMMQERNVRLAADLARSEAMVEERKARLVHDLEKTDSTLDCVPEGWDSPYYDATWFLGHAPTMSVAIDPHRIDSAPAPGAKWYTRPPFRKPHGIQSVLQR